MKRHLNLIITIILTLAAGIASFTITRSSAVTSTTAPEHHMSNWLELSSAQNEAIQTSEPDFQQEAAELSEAFRQERQTLARLFDNEQSSDEQILAQVEKVITSHNKLLQRVVSYILVVRNHLENNQKEKLLHLCGRITRGRPAWGYLQTSANGNGYQSRPGRGQGQGQGRGQGFRRGGGGGRGPGQGRGRHGRRWQGFAGSLELTPEQIDKAKELDPGFEEESQALQEQVRASLEQFAQRLESLETTAEEVRQHLNQFVAAHGQLERRNARHVVLIRSHLTPEQQKILVGLCARCGRQ